jgi:hypothetical protein
VTDQALKSEILVGTQQCTESISITLSFDDSLLAPVKPMVLVWNTGCDQVVAPCCSAHSVQGVVTWVERSGVHLVQTVEAGGYSGGGVAQAGSGVGHAYCCLVSCVHWTVDLGIIVAVCRAVHSGMEAREVAVCLRLGSGT